jgi:NYN domain-containing protein
MRAIQLRSADVSIRHLRRREKLMPMAVYVYVDNSKLWAEGKRLSAVKAGLAFGMHDAVSRDVLDNSWNHDLGKLYQAVCPPDETIGGSSLFGCRPLGSDSVWALATQRGFDLLVTEFDPADAYDVAVATKVMADSYERMAPGDKAVLVAGGRDYVPVIDSLRSRKLDVLVAFWHHATARELRTGPAEFLSLDEMFDDLTN